jgi:hypothetical protein
LTPRAGRFGLERAAFGWNRLLFGIVVTAPLTGVLDKAKVNFAH